MPTAQHQLRRPLASPTAVEQWPSWIALGPSDSIIARAVRAATCPQITIDGSTGAMDITGAPQRRTIPMSSAKQPCRLDRPTCRIDGKQCHCQSPIRSESPLLGDTGCRLKAPDAFQACNDPAQWPFAQVAASAASWDPDLSFTLATTSTGSLRVLRRTPVAPAARIGDNWSAWSADFFEPAASSARCRALDSGSRQS